MHDALVSAFVLRNSHLNKYLKIHFYGTWHIVCASNEYICNILFRAKAFLSTTNRSSDTYMVWYMEVASISDDIVVVFLHAFNFQIRDTEQFHVHRVQTQRASVRVQKEAQV